MKYSVLLLTLCAHLLTHAQIVVENFKDNSGKQAVDSGIVWTIAPNWQEVVSKAKKENKYIFVDCYATWCGPCKLMDKDVYAKKGVGDYINSRFISIKLQMDTTQYDDQITKSWYADARRIEKGYSITSFPTLLFFSPEGKPLHKATGFMNSEEFIALSVDAADPRKQYYAILNEYKPGKYDTSELKGLAISFKRFNKELSWKLAEEYFLRIHKKEWGKKQNLQFMINFSDCAAIQKIATEYLHYTPEEEYRNAVNVNVIERFKSVPEVNDLMAVYLSKLSFSELKKKNNPLLLRVLKKDERIQLIATNYINRLKGKDLYKIQNIELLADNIQNTSDKCFQFFFKNGSAIDAAMQKKGYALKLVDYWIDKEQISPHWENALNEKLDWNVIYASIERKYSKEFAERIILNSKVFLYNYLTGKDKKYWNEYLNLASEKIRKYPPDTADYVGGENFLNEIGWYTFIHSNDKVKLHQAIEWMDGLVKRHPKDAAFIDTYANLLYKAGRKEEAIAMQERACKLSPESKDFLDGLDKMKKGLPTWN